MSMNDLPQLDSLKGWLTSRVRVLNFDKEYTTKPEEVETLGKLLANPEYARKNPTRRETLLPGMFNLLVDGFQQALDQGEVEFGNTMEVLGRMAQSTNHLREFVDWAGLRYGKGDPKDNVILLSELARWYGRFVVEEGFANWSYGKREPQDYGETTDPFKYIEFSKDVDTKSDPMVKSLRKLRERVEKLFPRARVDRHPNREIRAKAFFGLIMDPPLDAVPKVETKDKTKDDNPLDDLPDVLNLPGRRRG